MVLKKMNHLISAAAALLSAGLLLTRCTVDDVERPVPRIDFRYEGSETYSDTVTVVAATNADVLVYLFATAGLKSHTVTFDGETVSDSTYGGNVERVCDTVEMRLQISGSSVFYRTISVTVTDWQEQATEKTLVIAYTPGGTVVVRPTILSNPSSTQATVGARATFTTVAAGGNLSFQWQKNGADIAGATSTAYTTPPVESGDNGARFRCIVRNSAGRDTSAAATLTVNRAPVAVIGQSYQGGIVFYMDSTGQHGLIAATSDLSTGAAWGCDGTAIGGTAAGLGSGAANTAAIIGDCSTAGIAARLCSDLSSGGYSDWYLPSEEELDLLYDRKNSVGGFSGLVYWGSTEHNATTAALQFFDDGYQLNASKGTSARVRAIRAF